MKQHGHNEQHHATPGMLKDFYNKNSAAQGSVVRICRPLLQRAAAEVPLPPDNCLNIGEWGCSHGGNSIEPVLLLCSELQRRLLELPANNRSHCRPLQVHVTHTDVPGNDWATLFHCAQQYVQQAQGSFPELHVTYAGIGGSMYRRNLPSGSLDVGFAFSTLHWQSKKAVTLKASLFPVGDRVLPEERAVLQAHALSDLKSFLLLRAEEFRPGGLLVLGYVSSHDAPGDDGGGAEEAWDITYHKVAQDVGADMVADGLLRQHELGLMSPPVYFLDKAARMQVLHDVGDSWELLHHEQHKGRAPITTAWRAGEATDEQLAEAYVAFFKAVSYPCFEAGLRQAGREQGEVDGLLAELYGRLFKAACARAVAVEFPFAAMLLRRRGGG